MAKKRDTPPNPNEPRASSNGMHQYDDILGSELVGLFRTSVTGRILDCNHALAQLLGYETREALMAVPAGQLYLHADERQQYLDDLLEKKRLNDYEVLLKHRNGRPVHVLEKVVLREEPGRASVIEGMVVDITSLRQSELEQRLLANNFRQLTERIRDGIIMLQEGRVVYANPAAEVLVGVERLAGAAFGSLLGEDDGHAVEAMLAALARGETPSAIHATLGRSAGRSLLIHGLATWHMNRPAIQLTLQDVEAERSLMQERLRAAMAEEVNASLRAEIEEHRQTQKALKQSRRLAKSLVDSSLDMIVAVDQKGIITEFNPAACIKFEYEPEEVLGKSSQMLYADEQEYHRVQQEMDRFGAYAGEVQNINRDGLVFVSFLAASRVRDEDGKVLGSMGVSRDVTQAKKDRDSLRESEERYRDLVDNATDLIQSVDKQGRFLFTNKAWRKNLGYTEEDLRNITIYDLMVDDQALDKSHKWMAGEHRVRAGDTWRALFRAKDGQLHLMEGTSNVRDEKGSPFIARSIIRDITESHAAQEKLVKHVAKEKALFESSAHLFWTVDRRIALTSFNQGYSDMIVRLHGKAPQINTDKGKPRELFAAPDYHDFWKVKYDEAFKGNIVRFETDLLDQQGRRVCNEIYLSPVHNAKGEVEEVFGIGHEVTAERLAEARAREQAAKLNAIFENSADVMIWSVDRDLRITAFNKHFGTVTRQATGKDVQEGGNIRKSFSKIVGPREDKEWLAIYQAGFAGKHQHRESCITGPDGEIHWLEVFISPVRNEQGEVHELSGLAYDITDKKKAEQEMVASLREKEVLLREVHHRVKNNLQIISSIFNLQRAHVEDEPRCLDLVRDSQGRIQSMAFIHESLYQSKNFAQVDLANYLERLCTNLVMSYSLQGRIHLHTTLQPLMLDLDKAIPCGLIMNELVSNALKHAFPGGGKGQVDVYSELDGDKVRITLADNGVGFPAQYVPHRDCGLGMELVQVLIGQLDGSMERKTSPGSTGTTYLINFERS